MQRALPRHPVWDIQPESLLGRKAFRLDPGLKEELKRARIQGQVIVVTGAAGFIGSELCRQIAALDPKALVGFDQAETPLFLLEKELSAKFPGVAFYPELGNAVRSEDAHRIFARHRPSIVYHTSAYKHVSMMERNVGAAVENNVLATWRMARAAAAGGVETFVLVSSDKAVCPASVMGATKRVAELAIRCFEQEPGTKFVAVRFGNVLGSSGSALPIFQQQIAAGGPITVTHPEMSRYFMTASEAAQLVLHTSALGAGGEVFIFDLGEPIRILDLATNLIERCGLSAGRDIAIEFIGMQPGEKLSEQMHLASEVPVPTRVPGISCLVSSEQPDKERMRSLLRALEEVAEARDDLSMILLLKEAVPDYTPVSEALKVIAMASHQDPTHHF